MSARQQKQNLKWIRCVNLEDSCILSFVHCSVSQGSQISIIKKSHRAFCRDPDLARTWTRIPLENASAVLARPAAHTVPPAGTAPTCSHVPGSTACMTSGEEPNMNTCQEGDLSTLKVKGTREERKSGWKEMRTMQREQPPLCFEENFNTRRTDLNSSHPPSPERGFFQTTYTHAHTYTRTQSHVVFPGRGAMSRCGTTHTSTLTCSDTHLLTHALAHTLTCSHTHLLTHSLAHTRTCPHTHTHLCSHETRVTSLADDVQVVTPTWADVRSLVLPQP